MHQRSDTFKRQMGKYGHSCCKRCFGKEQTFRDAQNARTDSRSHPHSEETKKVLSALRMGKPSWNRGLKASDDERVRVNALRTSVSKKGMCLKEDNPNWKGGVSGIKKPFPKSGEFQKWMKFRNWKLKEDFYQCFKCSNRFFANQLEVHHLSSQSRFPDLIFDEQNCITFCIPCHVSFHKKYGKKHFTPQHAIDFINADRSDNFFKLC